MSEVIKELEKLITPLMTQESVELVDLTYQKGPAGWTVSFFIDKPGGITLNDCSRWSEKIGLVLDQTDIIPHTYSLEVASPGIERPLKKLSDYQRFLGERVSIKLFAPFNGQKNFHGELKAATEEEIVLMTEEGTEISLPVQQIAKTKLNPIVEF